MNTCTLQKGEKTKHIYYYYYNKYVSYIYNTYNIHSINSNTQYHLKQVINM